MTYGNMRNLLPWQNLKDLGIINVPQVLRFLINLLHFFWIIIWLSYV